MNASRVDVATLLVFFNRPEKFKHVFQRVREARPSKLYLYQDGPRDEHDLAKIAECRTITESIDWDCEVHRSFQDHNVGCDPSMYRAIKWAFREEPYAIILEDDCVPEVTMFEFCKQLLDRYLHDERIGMISGFNPLYATTEKNEVSYIYTHTGSIWGWATWKRVIDSWDPSLPIVNDSAAQRKLYKATQYPGKLRDYYKAAEWHLATGKEYFESIHGSEMLLNHRLTIVPKCNLVSNIGVGGESTHSVTDIRLHPKGIRPVFNTPTQPMLFPLIHPRYIIPDTDYDKGINRLMAYDLPVKAWRKASIVARKAIYGRK